MKEPFDVLRLVRKHYDAYDTPIEDHDSIESETEEVPSTSPSSTLYSYKAPLYEDCAEKYELHEDWL